MELNLHAPFHALLYGLLIANIFVVCAAANVPQWPGVSTGPPPSEVTLIYPGDNITNYLYMPIGVAVDTSLAGAMLVMLNMSLTYPNGTTELFDPHHETESLSMAPYCTDPVLYSPDTKQPLGNLKEGFSSYSRTYLALTEKGLYTLHWNLTYGTSPNLDRVDLTDPNSHGCAAGPYSFQSFLMNQTFRLGGVSRVDFEARHNLSGNGYGDFFNHTTTLPAVPTGLVRTGNITRETYSPARSAACVMGPSSRLVWYILVGGMIAVIV